MRSMPVKILPIAREDVRNAIIYIASDDPEAANCLLERILEALDRASHYPLAAEEVTVGGKYTRRYRRLTVPPYNIYYRIIQDKIIVMRVLHERMDERKHLK